MHIPSSGVFITFEGGEGSGKSLQSRLLCDKLRASFPKLPVVLSREPGGSEGAERIRQLLTTGAQDRWLPFSEFLLFYAARYDHWIRLLLPVLQKGGIVLCDRFLDSSWVYQGFSRGLPFEFFDVMHTMMSKVASDRSFWPDRTYILDIDPTVGLQRSNMRQSKDSQKEDRFERIHLNFHEKVRLGYQKLAALHPGRCRLLEADRPVAAVYEEIWNDFVAFLQGSNVER